MEYDLSVTHEFGDYAVGQRITDREEVKKLASSPYVVKVAAAAREEKPEAKPETGGFAPEDKSKKA